MPGDLRNRKNQVPTEDYQDLPTSDHFPTQLAIQEHYADRAGKHHDVRILQGDKAVSFAVPKGLPAAGEKRLAIRQPDHTPDYMTWQGEIPKGQYGAGRVSLHDKQEVVTKTAPDRVYLNIPKGPNKGNYVFIKTDGQHNWLIARRPDMDRAWTEREKYKETPSPSDSDSDFIATEKLDGANFIAKLTPQGISFTSQRRDKAGNFIGREDNLPHLRDIEIPKELQGIELRGELWHPSGFNRLSGILNSAPPKAVASQAIEGSVRFAPFRLLGVNGKATGMTPDQEYAALKGITQLLNSPHVNMPQQSNTNESPNDFYNRIVASGGEGIILRNRNTGDFLKKKSRVDHDLKIVGFTPGEGKYKGNGIGAIVVADRTGRVVGNVGSGIDDETRRAMHSNPMSFMGNLIKVKSQPALVDKLRSPEYLGMTTDKDEPDELLPRVQKLASLKQDSRAAQKLPMRAADLNGYKLQIMIADTPEKCTRGLMFNRSLRENQGMLFVSEKPGIMPFWMANTPLALDLIYLDGDMLVTEIIHDMKPVSGAGSAAAKIYENTKPASYALEVLSGAADNMGIRVGDKLQLK